MAENNDSQNNNPSGDVSGTSNTDPITFESIAVVDVAELNDDQKAFILDNSGELTDEQRETYKDVLEGADDDSDKKINADDVEIQTRGGKKSDDDDDSGGDDDDNSDDDKIDPDDEKTIKKVVNKQLDGFRGNQGDIQAIKDKQEVNDYIGDNPEFKPYRDVMLKYMAHPAYKNIPVDNVAKIVAGSDLQKLGAKKEREAADKAKSTQDGGQTVRDNKGGGAETDWAKASKEAFEKKKNEVLGIRA